MPVDPEKLAALTEKFRQLNLAWIFSDPEKAAREELETGEPTLATYSFLKWLTDATVRPQDFAWMDQAIENNEPVLGPALKRLLDAGMDRNDLNTVVRVMQYRICDHLCFMLDQMAYEQYVPVQDFGVYHVGGGESPVDDKPIARLNALHEQIGAWDPLYVAREK